MLSHLAYRHTTQCLFLQNNLLRYETLDINNSILINISKKEAPGRFCSMSDRAKRLKLRYHKMHVGNLGALNELI